MPQLHATTRLGTTNIQYPCHSCMQQHDWELQIYNTHATAACNNTTEKYNFTIPVPQLHATTRLETTYYGVPLKSGLYMNRSGLSFLDNGAVTMFPVSLSRWQLNTFSWQRIPRQPTVRRCESTELFLWANKLNPSGRCSLCGRKGFS
jgi:hypothetical protein